MSRNLLAVSVACLAILSLTLMDSVIKALTTAFSTPQILMIRYGFGLAFAGGWFLLKRPGLPSRTQLAGHVTRTLTMLLTGGLFFYALARIPIAELFVITFLAPLFISLLGRLMLGERLSPLVGVGIALGFSGVVAIIASDPAARLSGGAWDGMAAALLSPVTYAFAFVLLRRQAGTEPPARIVFMQTVIGAALLTPFVLPTMPAVSGPALLMALAVGGLGTAGLLLLAYAMSLAEAARVSVAEYTGLLWAALIGWFIFGEAVRPVVWLGAVLIITGCLLAMHGRKPASVTPPAGEGAA
jgi:S-adenosylmethionine uptake transporter